jgi:hypothetical protein
LGDQLNPERLADPASAPCRDLNCCWCPPEEARSRRHDRRCKQTSWRSAAPTCDCGFDTTTQTVTSSLGGLLSPALREEDERMPSGEMSRCGKPAAEGQAQARLGSAHPSPARSRPSLIFRTTAPGRWDRPTGGPSTVIGAGPPETLLAWQWVDPAQLEIGSDDVLEATETRFRERTSASCASSS